MTDQKVKCRRCGCSTAPIKSRVPNPSDPSLLVCLGCGSVLKPDGSPKNRRIDLCVGDGRTLCIDHHPMVSDTVLAPDGTPVTACFCSRYMEFVPVEEARSTTVSEMRCEP